MVNGDAAEQVVRMSLEGVEVALRVTGSLVKNGAAALYALFSGHEKTAGQTRMKELLKSGKELKVFTIRADELQKFKAAAKQYGVLYTVLHDKENTDPHAELDLFVRMEDAPRINRIVEKYGFGTVREVGAAALANEPEQASAEAPEAAAEDKDALPDELFGAEETPEKKATELPERGGSMDDYLLDELFGKEEKGNPFAAQAQGSDHQSVNYSESLGRGSERPSVRKELEEIRREMDEKHESLAEKAMTAIEKMSEIKEEVSK